MEIKEAIENIEDTYDCHSNDRACCKEDRERIEKEKNSIIELLQRGEKYEAMWEKDLKDRMRNSTASAWETLVNAINDIEQKYFPKPSDNFTEKVMEKINKEVDNEI